MTSGKDNVVEKKRGEKKINVRKSRKNMQKKKEHK